MTKSIVFLGTEWDQTSIECLSKLLDVGYYVLAILTLKKRNVKIRNIISSFAKDIIQGKIKNKKTLKNIAKQNKIQYLNTSDINSPIAIKSIKKYHPDLICVCIFRQILKKDVINIPCYGTINMHPSLLPKYRGADPYFWVIKNAEKKTGVTIHFIDEGIDTGDIILQKSYLIPEEIDIIKLKEALSKIGSDLMVEAVNNILEKNVTRQSQKLGSKFPAPNMSHLIIDNNMDVKAIYKFIKGIKSMGPIFKMNEEEFLITDVINYDLCNHDKFPNYVVKKNKIIFYAIDGIIILKLESSRDKLNRYLSKVPIIRLIFEA